MGWRARAWYGGYRALSAVVTGGLEGTTGRCWREYVAALQRERLRGETIDGWPAHFTLRGPRG